MNTRRLRAFSLIELLVVLAIIALLATVAVSTLGSSGNARALAKAAGDVAGILELARTHAMANNSAVLVKLSSLQSPLQIEVFSQRPGETNRSIQRKRTFEKATITSGAMDFLINSRGELMTTNSAPLQNLTLALAPASDSSQASNNTTLTMSGLTGTIAITHP